MNCALASEGVRGRLQVGEPAGTSGCSGHLEGVEDHLGAYVRRDLAGDDRLVTRPTVKPLRRRESRYVLGAKRVRFTPLPGVRTLVAGVLLA